MGYPNANTVIPAATPPGRMKGRHVVRRIIVRIIQILVAVVVPYNQVEDLALGHVKVLERKQPMVLLPLRPKMRQKLNVHVLHIALHFRLIVHWLLLVQGQRVIVLILELTRGLEPEVHQITITPMGLANTLSCKV